ncbi:hypothetical protein B0H16DRAFT_1709765 [Mycena metata]|uniref:Uncharacterized protein n=1 Tax=Mycena metata TaxID=1033252 RepID=A0AAD7KGS9_9AGAR|nr:hypothetical protein B0H16DRAFT_1709765 [Mycena metata]
MFLNSLTTSFLPAASHEPLFCLLKPPVVANSGATVTVISGPSGTKEDTIVFEDNVTLPLKNKKTESSIVNVAVTSNDSIVSDNPCKHRRLKASVELPDAMITPPDAIDVDQASNTPVAKLSGKACPNRNKTPVGFEDEDPTFWKSRSDSNSNAKPVTSKAGSVSARCKALVARVSAQRPVIGV